jgi:hypothetical protein
MADLATVRQALAAAIATVPGLRATATVPGQITPPMAAVAPGPGTFLDYDQTIRGPGGVIAATYRMRITLFVSEAAAGPDSQNQLDAYLSDTGPASVKIAIETDPTLGGVADYTVVTSAQGYGFLQWGGITYLACHLLVTCGVV